MSAAVLVVLLDLWFSNLQTLAGRKHVNGPKMDFNYSTKHAVYSESV